MTGSRFACLFVGLVAAAGCESTPKPAPPAPPVGHPPPSATAPEPAYSGPADLGPCAGDADCRTVDVCGCSCVASLSSAQAGPAACDESCPGDGCKGKVARCNPSTRQCEAVAAVQ